MVGSASLTRLIVGLDKLITGSAVTLATAGLALAALIGLYQIIARFILHRAAEWSEPSIQMTLIWMTYLGLAGAMRSGTLISVDWFLSSSKGRQKKFAQMAILASVLTLLVCMAWFGTALAYKVRFQNIAGLGISVSWAYLALPVGAIVSMIAAIAHAIEPSSNVDHQTENT